MNLLQILASGNDIEGQVNSFSIRTVLVASLLLVVLMLISSRVVNKKKLKHWKKPLFILIAATIAFPSLLLTGSTVYINTISDSGGPVHWHTDVEFWVCGQEIELRDPIGALNNKIGTSSYHEHDDKRIHLEGVVIDEEVDASLGKFMDVTGGEISNEKLVMPIEESIFEDDIDGDTVANNQAVVESFKTTDPEGRALLSLTNGASCGDQANYGEVQAFLYSYNKEDKTYSQKKLNEPAKYTMRDEPLVPPGDCLIVEFDVSKQHTDKLCQQYGVKDSERCVAFGVSEYNPDLCNIREVDKHTDDMMHEHESEEQ